ncbi:MAG: diaminopimelate decarboxylase [Planctomycetes bacterium]|nr:diaminopimelate decarboxylase [Planctomycetota bacterium]
MTDKLQFFRRIDGALHAESTPLADVAREYGTPAYVYSSASFAGRFQYIYDAFAKLVPGRESLIAYSVKACSNLTILRLLAERGSAFDVVSGGELLRVARAGGDPSRIIFAGVGKRDDELELAIDAGVLQINVESRGELDRLQTIARLRGARARVALRVNPEVDADTHKHLKTGAAASKFGMSKSDAAAILGQNKQYTNIEFAGLHVHVGSMLSACDPYANAIESVRELISVFPGPIQTFDFGGGFAIDRASAPGLDPRVLAEKLAPSLIKIGARPILEPGRWIAAPSGVIITKVVDRKQSGGRTIVIVDAAMNDLIRPALYDAVHPMEKIKINNSGSRAAETVDVAGPVCESGDFLGRNVQLDICEPGDLIAILDAGAYGFSMASNYNSRPRPAEILVSGAHARVIRRRETFDDLLRGE